MLLIDACRCKILIVDSCLTFSFKIRLQKFSIAQKSLGDIPSTWNGQTAPTIVKEGYSGGSMFVLALFMLIIGAGIGVGVAFFLWKRQRGGGGLTYQVFE